jgi:hypothetical protein
VAKELGDKDDSVALFLGVVNPLQPRGANMREREQVARAERGEWAGASGADGSIRCVRMGMGHSNALNKALPFFYSPIRS